jgi:dienelactone hydrolase
VTGSGYAAAALDMPGWGGRPTPPEYGPFNAEIDGLSAEGKPLGDAFARRGVVAAELAVPEWRAALSWLLDQDWIGPGSPVGYWGVSLGTAVGLPLAAAEPKITAAVLGLMGHETLAGDAARLTVPVEFLLQWDDEVVPRDSGLALFDAIGSAEKTLHANPGGHADVPGFETAGSERFFARHLAPAAPG